LMVTNSRAVDKTNFYSASHELISAHISVRLDQDSCAQSADSFAGRLNV